MKINENVRKPTDYTKKDKVCVSIIYYHHKTVPISRDIPPDVSSKNEFNKCATRNILMWSKHE